LIDSWLLQRFPGRTLEELDMMDWPRYLKAMQAGNIEDIETKNMLQLTGKLKSEDITADEWKQIREHDEMVTDGN